jgi:hypothetical protein
MTIRSWSTTLALLERTGEVSTALDQQEKDE